MCVCSYCVRRCLDDTNNSIMCSLLHVLFLTHSYMYRLLYTRLNQRAYRYLHAVDLYTCALDSLCSPLPWTCAIYPALLTTRYTPCLDIMYVHICVYVYMWCMCMCGVYVWCVCVCVCMCGVYMCGSEYVLCVCVVCTCVVLQIGSIITCLLYTSPSPRDATLSRMPSSA